MIGWGYQLNGGKRYKCKTCNRTFNERTGTMFARLRAPIAEMMLVVLCYCHRVGLNSLIDIFKRKESTIVRWLARAAQQCKKVTKYMLSDRITYIALVIQLDELKTRVKTKANEQWIWTVIDAISKLWIAFHTGKRTFAQGKRFFKKMRQILLNKPKLAISDGLDFYETLLFNNFRGIKYAQIIKKYVGKKLDKIVIRGKLRTSKRKATQILQELGIGNTVNNAYIERLNLTLRNHCSRLIRRSICFSKKLLKLEEHIAILQAYYNLCRFHKSLKKEGVKRTPCMAAGLTDHCWSVEELLSYRTY